MMMTKRVENKTEVQTRTKTLTPLEEKVFRMRYGVTAPDNLPLEQMGQDDPKIAAQIRAIEERALSAVSARRSQAKSRIVDSLRGKK